MKKRFILSVAVIAILMVLCLFTACMDFNNPDEIEDPNDATIELTLNSWSNGTLTSEKKEQWFKFTATDANQYFHFKKLSPELDGVATELYNGKKNPVSDTKKTINDGKYTSYTVNSGKTYFIKVTPQWSKTGTYKIGFTASAFSPDALAADRLTPNALVESSITLDNENWFKFTANATDQYFHFKPGTLDDVYVELFDSNGITAGQRKNLFKGSYSSKLYEYFTVTIGQTYYIKVTPERNKTGTYMIGYNNSTIPPSNL
jgi:hypothetical protein